MKTNLSTKLAKKLKRASPTILTVVAVIGVVATAVTAVRATPKALEAIDEQSVEESPNGEPVFVELTPLAKAKTAWKYYIPTALIACGTISCIIGANVLNKRHQAQLISAYALIKESYNQYRGAAKSVYGEDADRKIQAEMAKETFVGDHSWGGAFVYTPDMDDGEKSLFYDMYGKRYFQSTIAAVINAQYHINRNLQNRGYATVNEFYSFLGIDEIDGGDEIGWSMDEILAGSGWNWLDFENHQTTTDDGLECCIISTYYTPSLIDEDYM